MAKRREKKEKKKEKLYEYYFVILPEKGEIYIEKKPTWRYYKKKISEALKKLPEKVKPKKKKEKKKPRKAVKWFRKAARRARHYYHEAKGRFFKYYGSIAKYTYLPSAFLHALIGFAIATAIIVLSGYLKQGLVWFFQKLSYYVVSYTTPFGGVEFSSIVASISEKILLAAFFPTLFAYYFLCSTPIACIFGTVLTYLRRSIPRAKAVISPRTIIISLLTFSMIPVVGLPATFTLIGYGIQSFIVSLSPFIRILFIFMLYALKSIFMWIGRAIVKLIYFFIGLAVAYVALSALAYVLTFYTLIPFIILIIVVLLTIVVGLLALYLQLEALRFSNEFYSTFFRSMHALDILFSIAFLVFLRRIPGIAHIILAIIAVTGGIVAVVKKDYTLLNIAIALSASIPILYYTPQTIYAKILAAHELTYQTTAGKLFPELTSIIHAARDFILKIIGI